VPSRARSRLPTGGMLLVGEQLAVDGVGDPALETPHRLEGLLALGPLASVVGPALGVETELGDGGDVDHVVDPAVPRLGRAGAGSARPRRRPGVRCRRCATGVKPAPRPTGSSSPKGSPSNFASRLASAMSAMTMGAGYDQGTTLGPLVSAATRDQVSALVEDAVNASAHVATGGSTPDGPRLFYPPTVLTNVAPDAAILQTEILGRSPRSSSSPLKTRRSGWPTTPSTASSPTSTTRTWSGDCESVSGSRPEWWA